LHGNAAEERRGGIKPSLNGNATEVERSLRDEPSSFGNAPECVVVSKKETYEKEKKK